ncbi:hypothetical protein E2C01_014921 [Portunus trituberculatus]|uniref:Uncharacterized protein n=1 Tax=Portunus trituberculatus TaxID=210409 RepID=A0A5B7DKF6_PORTR|nr:hypothetical protein [Portunus trituberculatus]
MPSVEAAAIPRSAHSLPLPARHSSLPASSSHAGRPPHATKEASQPALFILGLLLKRIVLPSRAWIGGRRGGGRVLPLTTSAAGAA